MQNLSVHLSFSGRRPTNFFICSGLNPSEDLNFPTKVNTLLNGCIIFSLLLHIAVRIRVSVFKRKTNLEQKSPKTSLTKKFKINFENQSLSDFATNIFIIFMFGGGAMILSKVNNFQPSELNIYPNFYYVYCLHMFAPMGFGASLIFAYYFRHKPLQTFTKLELKTLLENFDLP